jgi:diketogulonate reductase-like aldo/keto reductase
MKNQKLLKMADKYRVTIPQLSIRYCIELGLLPLPKTANPAHMKNNAEVDFEISAEDMKVLREIEQIRDYGDAGIFAVFKTKTANGSKK